MTDEETYQRQRAEGLHTLLNYWRNRRIADRDWIDEENEKEAELQRRHEQAERWNINGFM